MKKFQTVLFNMAFVFFAIGGMLIDSSIPAAFICFCIVGLCAGGIALVERQVV